ncbi:MAG: DASS family sodium-coupled anion symporter [bacterium]|nr:DASS family sodium-coupled anion symporter [bacterium]
MIEAYSRRQLIGLFAGPVVFVLLLLLPVPGGLKPEAYRVMVVAVLMATWWVTEAIPIPATALLPIALFPTLGVMPSNSATSPYANHLIYLFLGGFFIAMTMEKWNLHKRIALYTIRLVGTSPNRIVLGFMLATAFLSMWISNTATAMMMVPIALAVINQAARTIQEGGEDIDVRPGKFRFGMALMLGIAYSASIGGVGTIIGTPPNTIMVGVIEKTFGVQVSFAAWMAVGVPLSVVMLVATWYYLTRIAFKIKIKELPGGRELILRQIRELGPMKREEKSILAVFLFVSISWILRGFLHIPDIALMHDSTIAVIGALMLFVIPSNLAQGRFLLDWETAKKVPWDVILLFGGGLSLAHGFAVTGLAQWIGEQLTSISGAPMLVMIFVVVFVTIFLTEITSNTATATMLMPILASTAVAMAIHPYGLMVGAGIAASYAFMLPIATPPNAVVFGSGYVTIPQMAKAGFWVNLAASVLITLFIYFYLPWVWNLDLGNLPLWAQPK